MKNIFQKNLQFRRIWPRNRQKIVQIEVFGHFLDFASLVFLDFAHNDRWALCLVVFLQFAGPVNVFLLRLDCEQLHLSTKLGNLEAFLWGFSQDIQGIFKAAISFLNICFWRDNQEELPSGERSFGFGRRKNLEQFIVFKQSNFVNVFVSFFNFNSSDNLKYYLRNCRGSDLKYGYLAFRQSTTLNSKPVLTLPSV